MKRIALLAVIVGALVALPGSATARTDCSYTASPVYTSGGVTGDALLGVCVDTNTAADGGYLEIGSNGTNHYAVIDGSDVNPGAAGGYGGVVTGYETGAQDQCDQPADQTDEGSGTNQGGCFSVRAGNSSGSPVLISVPGIPLACGNTTGPDWTNAGRDGCTIP